MLNANFFLWQDGFHSMRNMIQCQWKGKKINKNDDRMGKLILLDFKIIN